MMGFVRIVVVLLRAFFCSRSSLVAENLALRQQLAVLQQAGKQPKLRRRDRIFWVWLSRLWRGWRSAVLIVQPETVIRWHRQGFRLYWRGKSWNRAGRPKIDAKICQLILCLLKTLSVLFYQHLRALSVQGQAGRLGLFRPDAMVI